ncbi:MAG: zinc-ribbon and DUF3426 domain-containing protein [Rhodanobacter sp.]
MYTQCPECLSVFSLDVHTLAQAHGFVVCGHCTAGFDSIATLAQLLPPEPFEQLPINEPAFEPPTVDLVVYRPKPPAAAVAAVVVVESPLPEQAPGDGEDFSQLVFAPRFARESGMRRSEKKREKSRRLRPARRSGERRWPWIFACSVFILLLAGQLAWAERDVLIRNPATGSWLQATCRQLGCDLPLVSAPQQLHLVASNVQAHPTVKGALMISASVRNEAAFGQPYPVLKVTLSDARGQYIAMRRLQPEEYLDDPAVLQRGLASGASAVLLLEVRDPGTNAVGFELAFE